MLNSVEEPFQEHVVLVFVSKLSLISCLESSHQLAELVFVDFAITRCILLEVLYQGLVEAGFSLFIVFVVDRPLEQIFNERCNLLHKQEVIILEVEQKCSENLKMPNGRLTSLLVMPF
jgi:hypothetical protein